MIKRIVFTIVLITTISFSFSQEKVLEFKNSLQKSESQILDLVPFFNESNKEISFFISDKEKVYGYKFDTNYKLIDTVTLTKQEKKYKIIIGNSVSDTGEHFVFLTNNSRNFFSILNFSFKKKEYEITDFTLGKGEKFIQTLSFDNQFYIISVNTKSFDTFLYKFNGSIAEKSKIDTSKIKLLDKKGKSINLGKIIIKEDLVEKIEENTPYPIHIFTKKIKIFKTINHNIIFAFDINNNVTQTLKIDLKTLKSYQKNFTKSEKFHSKRKKTNSFIQNNQIFILSSTRDTLIIEVFDYNSEKLVKEYIVKADTNEMMFKNTPFILEKTYDNKYLEFEDTKEFLKNISSSDIGISVIKQNNKNVFKLAGFFNLSTLNMMYRTSYQANYNFHTNNIFFSPIGYSYNAFPKANFVYTTCLFDLGFNNINDDVESNALDKVREINVQGMIFETIFKRNNYFLQTYYLPKKNRIYLRKYTNN